MTAPHSCRKEGLPSRFARLSAQLAGGLVCLYAAFMFCTALASAASFVSGSAHTNDIPIWNLLIGLPVAWILSLLGRGLFRMRLWAWAGSFAVTAAIGLFYLQNGLQFRWFTAWLLQIPAMLILLLMGLPAMLQERN